MNKMFTVSPSPHIHSGESTNKIMYGVLIALIPALLVSFYTFGIGALVTTLVAVIACIFFEWAIQKYIIKKGVVGYLDGSAAITGVLLAFNVPSSIPIWMIVVGSLVAIGVGKMSFGGLGQNPFNPALVGRVFMLMSFPVDMTLWPTAIENRLNYVDAVTGATPLAIMKVGIIKGENMSQILEKLPSYTDMFLGTISGSIGEISAFALIIGGIYMLYKKIITWHIPVAVLGSMFILAGLLNVIDSNSFADPVFHLITGGAMIGAIFMATDMVTSPMSKKGMLFYGLGIGIITIAIRTWGAYPEGMSFAILIMNAFVPIFNKYMRPKVFGVNKK